MTTRLPRPALLGAVVVTAFLAAVDLVSTLLTLLAAGPGPRELFGLNLLSELGDAILIGLGAFLVFWLLIPISASSTIARTIGGGAAAAAAGALLVALSNVLVALVVSRESSGSLYDLDPLSLDPQYLFANTVLTALHLLPLTVLAAVLVREWLRSRVAIDAPKEPAPAN